MTDSGASIGIDGSCEVFAVSAFSVSRTPAAIAPPKNVPFLSSTLIVEAVPISITTQGIVYSSSAPTAPATRSAPSCAGLSIFILSPVLTPGPKISGTIWHSFETAPPTLSVTAGTTEDIMQSSISSKL